MEQTAGPILQVVEIQGVVLFLDVLVKLGRVEEQSAQTGQDGFQHLLHGGQRRGVLGAPEPALDPGGIRLPEQPHLWLGLAVLLTKLQVEAGLTNDRKAGNRLSGPKALEVQAHPLPLRKQPLDLSRQLGAGICFKHLARTQAAQLGNGPLDLLTRNKSRKPLLQRRLRAGKEILFRKRRDRIQTEGEQPAEPGAQLHRREGA